MRSCPSNLAPAGSQLDPPIFGDGGGATYRMAWLLIEVFGWERRLRVGGGWIMRQDWINQVGMTWLVDLLMKMLWCTLAPYWRKCVIFFPVIMEQHSDFILILSGGRGGKYTPEPQKRRNSGNVSIRNLLKPTSAVRTCEESMQGFSAFCIVAPSASDWRMGNRGWATIIHFPSPQSPPTRTFTF